MPEVRKHWWRWLVPFSSFPLSWKIFETRKGRESSSFPHSGGHWPFYWGGAGDHDDVKRNIVFPFSFFFLQSFLFSLPAVFKYLYRFPCLSLSVSLPSHGWNQRLKMKAKRPRAKCSRFERSSLRVLPSTLFFFDSFSLPLSQISQKIKI